MTTSFPFRRPIWIERRTHRSREPSYVCRRADLELALADARVPENTLRLRLGENHFVWNRALAGEPLDADRVALIESALG